MLNENIYVPKMKKMTFFLPSTQYHSTAPPFS